MDGEADWEAMFGRRAPTVDWPAGYFYRELRTHTRRRRCC